MTSHASLYLKTSLLVLTLLTISTTTAYPQPQPSTPIPLCHPLPQPPPINFTALNPTFKQNIAGAVAATQRRFRFTTPHLVSVLGSARTPSDPNTVLVIDLLYELYPSFHMVQVSLANRWGQWRDPEPARLLPPHQNPPTFDWSSFSMDLVTAALRLKNSPMNYQWTFVEVRPAAAEEEGLREGFIYYLFLNIARQRDPPATFAFAAVDPVLGDVVKVTNFGPPPPPGPR